MSTSTKLGNHFKRTLVLILSVFSLLILVQQCAWFKSEVPEPQLIKPIPMGGYEELSTRIHYPRSVREQGVEGTVVVKAFVSESGVVTETRLAQKLEPELDRIASNAIQRTLFKPALREGEPEGVWIAIPIIYALKDWQPKTSPFSNFEMTVMPSPSYKRYEVKMTGQLKASVTLPLRFECLLPINADQAWVKTGSGEILNAGRVRDESGEWLIFETNDPRLVLGFNYQPISEQADPKFQYKFVMNHALPAWGLSVVYGDQKVRFSQDPDRISTQSDGRTRFEYDLESLEAFEPRYLEIELIE